LLCLYGPEKFPGLLRNRPLGRVTNKITTKLTESKECLKGCLKWLLDDLTEEGAQSWYFELFLLVQNYLKIAGNPKNSSLLKIEKH